MKRCCDCFAAFTPPCPPESLYCRMKWSYWTSTGSCATTSKQLYGPRFDLATLKPPMSTQRSPMIGSKTSLYVDAYRESLYVPFLILLTSDCALLRSRFLASPLVHFRRGSFGSFGTTGAAGLRCGGSVASSSSMAARRVSHS